MNTDEARRVLGVEPGADWPAVRAAHRRAIRRTHPDAGGSSASAALVNEALDVLRAPAPEPPADPAPAPRGEPPVGHVRPDDVDRFFLVAGAPGALLARLAEAGHRIGEVVFVDPHVGILEIVVGTAPNVGQLAVTVGPELDGGTSVAFTLEALGVDPAPPIDGVVDALMAAVGDDQGTAG